MSRTLSSTPDPGPPPASPSGRLSLDPDALLRAAVAFDQASSGYDARGRTVPPCGTGPAAPLVALALGAHLEAATTLVSEGSVLSYATRLSADDLTVTDALAALDLFRVRPPS